MEGISYSECLRPDPYVEDRHKLCSRHDYCHTCPSEESAKALIPRIYSSITDFTQTAREITLTDSEIVVSVEQLWRFDE